MFFVDGLTESAIWPIGDFAGSKRGKNAIARAEVRCSTIREIGFVVRVHPKEHPRHVNVGPWPAPKDEQKALALELCAKSALIVRSS
jgi:hypothetical protein